jgi:hypothetical protein
MSRWWCASGIVWIALAVGCGTGNVGGGDANKPLTLDQYFAELDGIQEEVARRSDQSAEPEIADDATLEELKDTVREPLLESAGILDDAHAQLKAIAPPAEVSVQHERLVKDFEAAIVAVGEFAADIENANTRDDVVEGLYQFADAASAFFESCNELQDLADDHDVEVELGCGG